MSRAIKIIQCRAEDVVVGDVISKDKKAWYRVESIRPHQREKTLTFFHDGGIPNHLSAHAVDLLYVQEMAEPPPEPKQ